MAPTTNFDKAQSDREALRDHLDLLETVVAQHPGVPLTQAEVDNYILEAAENRKQILDNHKFLRQSAPKDADIAPFVTDYKNLSTQTSKLQSSLHGIKMSFPVTSSTSTPDPSSSSTRQKIKLPPLELPKFGGNLQEWVSFRDIFLTAVHSTSLTKVEKLTQLKSLLTGEAARQVRSLTLSDNNYDIAWTSLQERYENNRELLFSILKRLINQPVINTGSAVNLRSLIDTSKECIRSLEVLSIPTQHWDAILLYLLFSKLDSSSRELWEQSLHDTAIPSVTKIYEFMEQRARALAASTTAPAQQRPQARPQQQPHVRAHHIATTVCKLGCAHAHPLFRCPEFQKMSPAERSDFIQKNNRCLNCLHAGHSPSNCNSKFNCKTCKRRHHTMLHLDGVAQGQPRQHQAAQDHQPPSVQSHHVNSSQLTTGVLATAQIQISSRRGLHFMRSLVDGGSTNSYITERAARRMDLVLHPCQVPMTGIQDASVGSAKYIASFAFKPHFDSMNTLTATALVVKSISSTIPSLKLKRQNWTHLNGLRLADPDFHIPGEPEVLLGTEIFWGILENEKISGADGQPFAIKSTLGWLVAGPNISSIPVTVFTLNADLDLTLRRFWEQETIPEETKLTKEEGECEQHFSSTHKRDINGRFTVSLPFKKSPTLLGSSRQAAVTRFISLERKYNNHNIKDAAKLGKLSQQWEEYKHFMHEYEQLGHMTLVPNNEIQSDSPKYYIPHHCVFKESSTTTKLRVVFDASAPTSNGISLNDCMMVGPQLQENIAALMLRFRTHPIAFTADIAKMYRQIRVAPADSDLQRILWREKPSLPIREYRLTTVTYGTSSAPYLAVKCLQQLAKDESERYPDAARVAINDFYVDDATSGCETLEQAKRIVQQLMDLCMSGGFELRKWTTNHPQLLEFIPEQLRETSNLIQLEPEDSTIKTLGVFWNPASDKYSFKLTLPPDMPGKYTKRIILSDIAKIYDPLGWLAPVIIVCKIFMQELWKTKLDWDDLLPDNIQESWLRLKSSLLDLERIEIPRCVIPASPSKINIIGCCDASTKAISAVIYIYCEFTDMPPTCHLLTSKTKVAPVKHVTLPKLELNGAVLLSELLATSLKALHRQVDCVRAYTDSTIAFHWINSDPLRWKPYVQRRVQAIQDNVPQCQWFHIPGERNPADCPSRGISAADLISPPLWWHGDMSFFSSEDSSKTELIQDDLIQLEAETLKPKSFHVTTNLLESFFIKYSSFLKLQRVAAYVIRFLNNFCHRKNQRPLQKGPLSVHEMLTSRNFIIRQLQLSSFPTEYELLKKGEELPTKSNLLKLAPIVSTDGLLRVGGRLRNAKKLTFDNKHQILLPRGHHITTIIIRDIHLHNFHTGPASTLAIFQQQYWALNGRDTIRVALRKCVTCTRFKPKSMEQIMGDLPFHRVNPSRPFSKVGVDYAGPFTIRPMVRSKVSLKCWLAIFVCFTTRAIHIEIVSSLTTECFLAAFRRFTSRRGKPSDIFSDCGTNFRGADKVLRDFFVLTRQAAIQDDVSSQQINWHFNPPGAPHFGGLWEAGVKSIKHHLVRVLGADVPTYEELYTLVVQIEGILNSRPLVPASADPSDLGVLTPAHFLIGESLAAAPDPFQEAQPVNHLKRWKLVQRQQQQFWKRWSSEFITRLQQRPKWCRAKEELGIGALVIIKEERLPPLKWKLGRVINVYPGPDGHVRVVSLKTQDGEMKRPIANFIDLANQTQLDLLSMLPTP